MTLPFDTGSTKEKVLRSAYWTLNSKVISQVMGFGTTLVLARLLSRDDFGLMAMALSFMGVMDIFVDLGFLSAIIQAKEIRRGQLSSCFWVLATGSLALTALGIALAPYIGRAFAETGVIELIYWLAPLFLLAPLNIICKGILSRNLRLDVLARIELFSGIPKMVLAIVLALAGFGVFSLVFAYMLERILLTSWAAFTARWYPKIEFDWGCIRDFLNFGSKATASSLLWYLYTKADVFVIGRVLGAEVLGVYSIASQFPQTIARLVPSTWNRIAYPLFSRHQDSPKLKQIVTQSSSLLSLVSLPLFLGIAALAPDIINLLFGSRWNDAILPLRMLSLVAAIETLTGMLPAVLNAIGRPGTNTIINVIALFVFPSVYYFSAQHWGIEGVLWAAIIVYLYRFLGFLSMVCYFLKLRLSAYAKAHLGILLSAGIMFLLVSLLNYHISDLHLFYQLFLCILIGFISYITAIFLFDRQHLMQILSYLKDTRL